MPAATVKMSKGTAPAAPVVAAAPAVTASDVKAFVEAGVKSALDKAMAAPRPEIATPLLWWDIYAIGPWQPGAQLVPPAGFGGPLLPHSVIRAGDTAYVVTVMVLNPFWPPSGPSALQVLSDFALPWEITYQTGNVTTWQKGPAYLNVEHEYPGLIPGQAIYCDVLEFTPTDTDEVMYEMNISARIFGCNENYAPPFVGFATSVYNIDNEILGLLGGGVPGVPGPGPVVEYNQPIRFLVYGGPPTPPV